MKLREGHIGQMQAVFLLYAVLSAKLFLQYPAFLIDVGGPAGWQAALAMTGAGLLLFLPMAALARRFPGWSLAEIGREAAGPVLGTVLTLFVCFWLLGVTANTVRNFTETFVLAILPTTPPSALIVVALLCMAYASYQGFEAVARSAQVLIPLIFAGALLVLIFSLPRTEVSRLYPFWGHGLAPTVTGGVWYAGMAAEAIILLVAGYAFREGKEIGNSGLLGILLFGITATVTVAVLIMIFGAPDAAQQPFPMFNLARLVYLGRFLQRTEALLVMFWFFAALVRLSALFHAGVISLTGALQLPLYRPIIFPMAVIVASLALVPEDFLIVLRLDRDWYRPLGLYVMLIPLLLLVLAAIRRKGGTPHEA